MSETAEQLIEMLTILKDNCHELNVLNVDATIISDCKMSSFMFVVDQAIDHIKKLEKK